MTSTAMTTFAQAPLPAHLAELFGTANIAPRASIDQLSYRGKVWRRIVAGEETQLTRRNAEGDTEPVQIVSLVVLDHNKARSRSFYPGSFEEGKNVPPSCYSGDGISPDKSVKEPCAKTCNACPNAAKGSKITDTGKQATACSQFKRIAVVPVAGIGRHPAMLLRLAQTSMWDKDNKENEAKGWFAWDQYLDMLRARGANHTAAVETKVKFDLRMAYPKLLFSAARWLTAEEAQAAKASLTDSAEAITTILEGLTEFADTPARIPAADTKSDADDGFGAANAAAEAAYAAKAAAERAAADNAELQKAIAAGEAILAAKEATAAAAAAAATAKKVAADKKAAKVAAANAAAAAAAVAAKAAAEEADDEEDGFGEAPPPVAPTVHTAPSAAPAAVKAVPMQAAVVVEGTPAGLNDLLAGWDD